MPAIVLGSWLPDQNRSVYISFLNQVLIVLPIHSVMTICLEPVLHEFQPADCPYQPSTIKQNCAFWLPITCCFLGGRIWLVVISSESLDDKSEDSLDELFTFIPESTGLNRDDVWSSTLFRLKKILNLLVKQAYYPMAYNNTIRYTILVHIKTSLDKSLVWLRQSSYAWIS